MKHVTVDARMINASGIGTVIKNILKRIITQKREWHFYILGNIAELKKFDFLCQSNTELINCDAPIYSIKEQFALIKSIPEDTDVFWAPHYNIPLLYSGRLVVTVHDVFHLAMPQFVKGIHKRVYARFMFEMVKRKADKIIAVSNFTASELEKYVHVPKEKITVIYNGIDEEWFNVERGEDVHDKPYILYVGNVKPHKNLITLVKAFMKIKDKVDYDLIIVGKRDGFITGDQEIAKMAAEEPNRIIFTGFVEDEQLKQYYKQAAIFVFPSLYEGFGLPPLEALAAGCPRVICSNAASLPEVCGDVVEYFDSIFIDSLICTILSNISLMSDLAMRKAKSDEMSKYDNKNTKDEILYKFDWEITVKKLIDILN